MQKQPIELDWQRIDPLIRMALDEDIGAGDITTERIVPPERESRARIVARADGVITGLPVAERVLHAVDASAQWRPRMRDGQRVRAGETVATMLGAARSLLTAERTLLNFLQRLSGVATITARFVEAITGLPTQILDTRKTLPGWRLLDKYAVRMGGGRNHRIGLFDGILIKENHIAMAGGIAEAVARVRRGGAQDRFIEVEVTTSDEVREALAAGADMLLLDNMDLPTLREAVKLAAGQAKTEASGGVRLDTVRAIAETGVDYISVGALTHSAPALDLAMYLDGEIDDDAPFAKE
ncbi:MAG: carboxylating nicotinate-nucleotide diphosphorylase [candidate division KSB1 bacterium]|nr:carboxylating nicotinate-nucleotide diphosphorylase [candidate division KSB1 bacterium]